MSYPFGWTRENGHHHWTIWLPFILPSCEVKFSSSDKSNLCGQRRNQEFIFGGADLELGLYIIVSKGKRYATPKIISLCLHTQKIAI